MKDIPEYEKDLASIRTVMEKSVKFISLSGLAGVLSGIYALVGSTIAYYVVYYPSSPFGFRFSFVNEEAVVFKLMVTATLVLVTSLSTGYLLSAHKARVLLVSVWNQTSKQLLIDLIIPLVSGGVFILILISRGYYIIVAPACLLFYGLALINASRNTFDEVRYLGLTEIVLGLICAWIPGYGLIFWATGFGIMHIVYGAIMHFRYER